VVELNPMARHASIDRQRHGSIQGAQRAIARGERPLYRLRPAEDGRRAIEGMSWVSVSAPTRDRALAAARAALAEMLEVPTNEAG
jgi:hypothetical protein